MKESYCFETGIKGQDVNGKEEPVISGRVLDLYGVSSEDKFVSITKALEDAGIKDKPVVCFNIGAPVAMDLKVEGIEDPREIISGDGVQNMAKIMVPVSNIVDSKHLKLKMGESAIRCNPAFPNYRWFQAINLELMYKGETSGRVIPFPLLMSENGGAEETIYHAMRVNRAEYEAYQKLLTYSVMNDGLEMGFYHAAKFAYEILEKRGCTDLTEKSIGNQITKITMMGRPFIRGVLITNASDNDFEEEKEKYKANYILNL